MVDDSEVTVEDAQGTLSTYIDSKTASGNKVQVRRDWSRGDLQVLISIYSSVSSVVLVGGTPIDHSAVGYILTLFQSSRHEKPCISR